MSTHDPLLTVQPHWMIKHPLVAPLALASALGGGIWKTVIAHVPPGEWWDLHVMLFAIMLGGVVILAITIYLVLARVAWRILLVAEEADIRGVKAGLQALQRDVLEVRDNMRARDLVMDEVAADHGRRLKDVERILETARQGHRQEGP